VSACEKGQASATHGGGAPEDSPALPRRAWPLSGDERRGVVSEASGACGVPSVAAAVGDEGQDRVTFFTVHAYGVEEAIRLFLEADRQWKAEQA